MILIAGCGELIAAVSTRSEVSDTLFGHSIVRVSCDRGSKRWVDAAAAQCGRHAP
jgi:hypothetical protein